jgi:starch synthase
VWIISPYYERNRKGETGYLAKDPAGINYKMNISVTIGTGIYTLGVHQGIVNNVNVVFIHNSDIFPVPYPDSNAEDTVKQLAIFAKSCLEFCCKKEIIPALCVTNDWFTGLVPAYAKAKAFGDTF